MLSRVSRALLQPSKTQLFRTIRVWAILLVVVITKITPGQTDSGPRESRKGPTNARADLVGPRRCAGSVIHPDLVTFYDGAFASIIWSYSGTSSRFKFPRSPLVTFPIPLHYPHNIPHISNRRYVPSALELGCRTHVISSRLSRLPPPR